jgi:N utilization substance protein B
MPDVDRAIARLATYEILFVEEVPDGVAISEAVELATDLSTAESPRFIAGLLHAIAGGSGPADQA